MKWHELLTIPLLFIKGGGKISYLQDRSALVLASVETTQSAKLRLNQFYFPGWTIKVDDIKWPFNHVFSAESYGLMVFDVGAGKHQVLAEFRNSRVRNIADAISIISLVIMLTWGYASCFKRAG